MSDFYPTDFENPSQSRGDPMPYGKKKGLSLTKQDITNRSRDYRKYGIGNATRYLGSRTRHQRTTSELVVDFSNGRTKHLTIEAKNIQDALACVTAILGTDKLLYKTTTNEKTSEVEISGNRIKVQIIKKDKK